MEVTFPNMPDSSDLALELEQATHVKNQLNGFSLSYGSKRLRGVCVKTENRTISALQQFYVVLYGNQTVDFWCRKRPITPPQLPNFT